MLGGEPPATCCAWTAPPPVTVSSARCRCWWRCNSGQTLRQALKGLVRVPQKTVNVRLGNVSAKATVQADSVQAALAVAQQSVAGRGRAFLRPSGTEPVVRVTVEADDAALMQDTLDRLSAAVREAAA